MAAELEKIKFEIKKCSNRFAQKFQSCIAFAKFRYYFPNAGFILLIELFENHIKNSKFQEKRSTSIYNAQQLFQLSATNHHTTFSSQTKILKYVITKRKKNTKGSKRTTDKKSI